jgi:hypothetical protein
MANIGAVTRQIAALEISAKQNGATKQQSRSLHHQKTTTTTTTSQTNVSKLLTKFAAPNPFPDPKVKAAAAGPARIVLPPRPVNPAAAKQPQPAPAPAPARAPARASSQAKPSSSNRELDIGKYDGGFEIENEKRGEAVDGEAAQDLALDSSVSRYSFFVPSLISLPQQLTTQPCRFLSKNTPHPRMAPYRL